MGSMAIDLGPRREALLQSWGNHVTAVSSGPGFNFSDSNKTARMQARTQKFLDKGTEDAFRTLWSMDHLTDAVFGGPDLVLKRFSDIEELVALIKEIDDADTYDSEWESSFPARTAVWELYGRLHPESAPILNSEINLGLKKIGLAKPSSFTQAQELWAEFEETYVSHIGHATASTSHEVPLNHEISEFLRFVATTNDDELVEILGTTAEKYEPIYGWSQEAVVLGDVKFSGLKRHLDGYVEAKLGGGMDKDGPTDLWNRGYWEAWKDAYLKHMETTIKPTYDLTGLEPGMVESFIDDLNESTTLTTPVPSYMLGGRQGGILWSQFKSRSLENPEEAAEVLSYVFDEEKDIGIRLDRFGQFYRMIETSGGPLLSLATILLTFAYPDEYIFYKWSLMNTFFSEFTDYHVETGFNPDQYAKLNWELKSKVLPVLRKDIPDATMLDVHTLLYVLHKEHLAD